MRKCFNIRIAPFLGSFFAALVLTLALFILVVNYCGRGVTDQPWFLEMYPLKERLAQDQKGAKIIVIGGSSSLFGVDGEKLKQYTGMDNVNLSMSIMVPMRFYSAELENFVREGDVVVLPLELTNHYCDTAEKNFSNFGVSLLFSGIPEAQKTLDFEELASLYFQYGFSWVNSSLFHEQGPLRRLMRGDWERQAIFSGHYRPEYCYAQWKQWRGKPDPKVWYAGLSAHGDWMVDQDTGTTTIQSYPLPVDVSEEFVTSYRRIEEVVRSRNATLLLVWPNMYFYPEQKGFGDFRKMLVSHGIVIHGCPEASAFPKCLYHDPIAHMNRQGAALWTYELAKVICRETGRKINAPASWPYTVFADDPARYFSDAAFLEIYDTGVEIAQKEFSLVVDVPEALRGKPLEMDLVAVPHPHDTAFTGIRIGDHVCRLEEILHQERAEITIHVPAECTDREKLSLSCAIKGDKIGMERLFVRLDQEDFFAATDLRVFRFGSGFSAMENWGRWTDGARAEFSLTVPPHFRGKKVMLTFDAYTFAHPKKPVCRFTVSSGGKVSQKFETSQFESRFALEIPAELTQEELLPLTIEIDDPVVPCDLGISADPRKLGVGIKTVTWEEKR